MRNLQGSSSNELVHTQITVKNFTYSIKDKIILSDVTALFKPGRLSVIIGPSGSGKTTLLSSIAGLVGNKPKKTKISGDILFNDTKISTDRVRKIVGFVFQDDIIMETMTVKEAVNMSTMLRVNASKTKGEQITDRMLQLSNLTETKDVMIGSTDKKGVSGGERKRTAIAMELVSNPSVMILDEPTSGLDTYTAFRIVKLLKRLAHKNKRTVIATLHQPSSEIFHLIDDLYVLHDGKIIYGGPCDKMIPYFTEAGYNFPKYSNPLDVLFMSILNSESTDMDIDMSDDAISLRNTNSYVPVHNLAKYYKYSDYYNAFVVNSVTPYRGVTKEMNRFRAKRLRAFLLLLKRNMKNTFRDPRIVLTRLLQTVFLAGFVAVVFWNTKYAPFPARFQNISGAIFFIVTNAFFASFQNVLPVFVHEKKSFIREHSQGYYGTSSYFLSKMAVELPFITTYPVITSLIIYWSLGFRSGISHLLVFIMTLQLVSLTGFSFGLATAAMFDDIAVAQAVSILFILPILLFSGLVLNVATIPAFLRWFQWVSPMRYGFTNLMTNQFVGWDAPGSRQYYENLDAGNGLSIFLNTVLLTCIFIAGLIVAYISLIRLVKKKNGSSLSLIKILKFQKDHSDLSKRRHEDLTLT